MTQPEKIDLYVFDFDTTVIEENSDTCFYNLFPGGSLPEELRSQYKENSWTAFMNLTLSYMNDKMGITSGQIQAEIQKCHLVGGMKELFEKIKSKNGEIIISSDANSLFIEWILQQNHIKQYFQAVYTNPAHIQDDKIIVNRFFNSHDCPLCTGTPNMCKSLIIKQHIALNPNRYNNIHYFGDGGNDFCPMQSLPNEHCTGYVRSGFGLEKRISTYLSQPNVQPFKCNLVYWKQAFDFLAKI